MSVVDDIDRQIAALLHKLAQLETRPTGKIIGCRKYRSILGIDRPGAGDAQSAEFDSLVTRRSQHLVHRGGETGGNRISTVDGPGRNLCGMADRTLPVDDPRLDGSSPDIDANRGFALRGSLQRASEVSGN